MTQYKQGSSRLLIDGDVRHLHPELAVRLGLNEAIVLSQVHYWLTARTVHRRDGRLWVYNTMDAWHKQFPFWSLTTVRSTFATLRERGLLLATSDYNRMKIDRTLWYTVDYEALAACLAEPLDLWWHDAERIQESDESFVNPRHMERQTATNPISAEQRSNTRDYTETTRNRDLQTTTASSSSVNPNSAKASSNSNDAARSTVKAAGRLSTAIPVRGDDPLAEPMRSLYAKCESSLGMMLTLPLYDALAEAVVTYGLERVQDAIDTTAELQDEQHIQNPIKYAIGVAKHRAAEAAQPTPRSSKRKDTRHDAAQDNSLAARRQRYLDSITDVAARNQLDRDMPVDDRDWEYTLDQSGF
jgi:hypothetical protein